MKENGEVSSLHPESQNNMIKPEAEYFEQLEILYSLFKLKKQRDILKQKLIDLKKQINQNVTESHSYQIQAIKKVIRDILAKRDDIIVKLKDEFNAFKILEDIANIKKYMKELNKKYKKRLINTNTHRTTYNHYEVQLKTLAKNLEKLQIISKDYNISIMNCKFELQTQQRILKWEKSKKQLNRIEYMQKKQEIQEKIKKVEEKINFIETYLINIKHL